MHTHTCASTCMCTQTRTHTDTQTHARTHARTHTRTHAAAHQRQRRGQRAPDWQANNGHLGWHVYPALREAGVSGGRVQQVRHAAAHAARSSTRAHVVSDKVCVCAVCVCCLCAVCVHVCVCCVCACVCVSCCTQQHTSSRGE